MLCQTVKSMDLFNFIHYVNGKKQQVDLCKIATRLQKTDPNNSLFDGLTNMNNHNMDPFDDFFNHLGISRTKGFYTSNSVRWCGGGNYGPEVSNNNVLSHPPINQKVFWKSFEY